MNNLIINFWYGKITLWKSYWLVGELINALIFLLFFNIELRYYNNNEIINQLPFINISNFHLISKVILFMWTIFITVGIWRSAESYKGNVIWIALTLIFLSYRIFTLRILFT